MRKKGGLGRGLDALIPQTSTSAPTPEPEQPREPVEAISELAPATAPTEAPTPANLSGLVDIGVDTISPNPRQPRQEIGNEQLDELAASVAEHGILQPVVVTRTDEGYNLIAGERRWRAAILAGLPTVPALVKEASSREMLELALVENVQRADLNSLEEASAYQALVEEFGLKQEEVAARVGKSRQAVSNALRLLKLPTVIQESLALGLISEGHARAILQVPDEAMQIRLMEQTVAEGLSVRQVEALARRLADAAERGTPEPKEEQPANEDLYSEISALEDRFRTALGTKVQLSRSRRGGKLVIYFYSDEELGRIYGTIVGQEE